RATRAAVPDQPILDENVSRTLAAVVGCVYELLPHRAARVAAARGRRGVVVRIDLQRIFVGTENAAAAERRHADTRFGRNIADVGETAYRRFDEARGLDRVIVPVARRLRFALHRLAAGNRSWRTPRRLRHYGLATGGDPFDAWIVGAEAALPWRFRMHHVRAPRFACLRFRDLRGDFHLLLERVARCSDGGW